MEEDKSNVDVLLKLIPDLESIKVTIIGGDQAI